MNTRGKGAIPKTTSGIGKLSKDTKSRKIAMEVLNDIVEAAVSGENEITTPSQQAATAIPSQQSTAPNDVASNASVPSEPADGDEMECDASEPIANEKSDNVEDDGIDGFFDADEIEGLDQAIGLTITATSTATSNVQPMNTQATMSNNQSAPNAQPTTASVIDDQSNLASNVAVTNAAKPGIFDKNADYSLPTHRFSPPNNIQVQFPVVAQIHNESPHGNERNTMAPTPNAVPDIRLMYMKRLREYRNRLNTGAHNKVSLEILLENVSRYADQLIKYIEQFDDTRVLNENELVENQQLWEQACNMRDEMTAEIRTRLEYLVAGRQQNAAPAGQRIDNRHPDHIRRMDAKITPFDGKNDRDMWPTFKAKFEQYYHKCQYITDLDKFIKLDEFIVPRSEAFDLISSFDRGLESAYQDAWNELCAKYDNPRRQVDEIIAKYLAIKPIGANREGLSRLYNGINHLIKSLPRLNVDVSTWDPIIVHIGESKLDFVTFDLWRRERNSKEVARLAPFVEFLQKEIDRRDHPNNQQQSRQQSTSQQPSTSNSGNRSNQSNNQSRSDNAGAAGGAPSSNVKSQIKRPIKCPMCNAEHHLYSCDTFRRLDLENRRKKVRALKVCENCLRPNCSPNRCTLRPCQNEGCGAKHNGLLCSLSTRPSVNAARESHN